MSSFFWVILNLLLAVIQFLMPFFSEWTGVGLPIEVVGESNALTSPESPADFTFSIWFLIFLLSLFYCAYHTFNKTAQNAPLFQLLKKKTALLFFLNSLWMLFAQVLGAGLHLLLLIIVMCSISLNAHVICLTLKNSDKTLFYRWIARPLIGLTSGWLTAALFLSLSEFVKPVLRNSISISDSYFAVGLILSAATVALFITWKTKGDLWYSSAVLWALFGIMVTNVQTGNVLVLSFALIAFCITLLSLLRQQRTLFISLLLLFTGSFDFFDNVSYAMESKACLASSWLLSILGNEASKLEPVIPTATKR